MPILDIAGAYCPQGCGQTLHLMASGMIQCLGKDCPDPQAVQKILADPETMDIVAFYDGHFSVVHPLRERIGAALLNCPVAQACQRMSGPPDQADGKKYRAWLDEDGKLVLKQVGDDG